MKPNQRRCKHKLWMKAIVPWGECRECGINLESYLVDLFHRCYKALPDGKLKRELQPYFMGGGKKC